MLSLKIRFSRIHLMTKDDLFFYLQTKKNLEFTFKDKVYSLLCDKDSDGKDIIVFGRLYEGKKYSSFGELINQAKIDNYYFKDLLEDINI